VGDCPTPHADYKSHMKANRPDRAGVTFVCFGPKFIEYIRRPAVRRKPVSGEYPGNRNEHARDCVNRYVIGTYGERGNSIEVGDGRPVNLDLPGKRAANPPLFL
jgi:hypothetical protein